MANKYLMLVIASLLMTACASIDPISIKGPDGKQGYTMKCSGMGRTIEQCYQKAGELCSNGYIVVGQDNSTIAVPVNGSIMAAPRRNLTIECK